LLPRFNSAVLSIFFDSINDYNGFPSFTRRAFVLRRGETLVNTP